MAFADFGLSKEKKKWCRARGELFPVHTPPFFVKDRIDVGDALAEEWESRCADTFWESREAWFKKPHACAHSPFELTLWMDLDCEITGSLEGIWAAFNEASGVLLAKDQGVPDQTYSIYNSGVIAFRKNHPLILEWARQSIDRNGSFRGDQDLLSLIIAERQIPVGELPPIYNWSIGFGMRKDIVVYHWLGAAAKSVLRDQFALEAIVKHS